MSSTDSSVRNENSSAESAVVDIEKQESRLIQDLLATEADADDQSRKGFDLDAILLKLQIPVGNRFSAADAPQRPEFSFWTTLGRFGHGELR